MEELFTNHHLFPAGIQPYLHAVNHMIACETKQSPYTRFSADYPVKEIENVAKKTCLLMIKDMSFRN